VGFQGHLGLLVLHGIRVGPGSREVPRVRVPRVRVTQVLALAVRALAVQALAVQALAVRELAVRELAVQALAVRVARAGDGSGTRRRGGPAARACPGRRDPRAR
jgi:hypothetical protein